MENLKRIENRIWKYRTVRGLKQSELAFLIGQKNSGQVSRYERGLVIPTLEQLTKICFGLETEIKDLYPDLIAKWRREIEVKKTGLGKAGNKIS
ncbi:MAG: helix-turn-helix transcriptional regulator [Candidatus Omnitrophota bacterium]